MRIVRGILLSVSTFQEEDQLGNEPDWVRVSIYLHPSNIPEYFRIVRKVVGSEKSRLIWKVLPNNLFSTPLNILWNLLC